MRRLILTLAALSLLACGGDSTGPIASAAGNWQLQSVNGSNVPFTVIYQASPVYRFEIVNDNFTANANGTYTETFSLRETIGSTVTTQTQVDNGTWSQANGALTIYGSDGTVSSAAITGNTITANLSGDIFVYRRN